MKRSPTKDDVAHLIKGKPTASRVGSRAVSHRLRKHEVEKLNLAGRRGYLTTDESTRDALKNAWFLVCQVKGIAYILKDAKSEKNNP